jgi:hypothetical protein
MAAFELGFNPRIFREMSIHSINRLTVTRAAAPMSCFAQGSLAPWAKVRVLSGSLTG